MTPSKPIAKRTLAIKPSPHFSSSFVTLKILSEPSTSNMDDSLAFSKMASKLVRL